MCFAVRRGRQQRVCSQMSLKSAAAAAAASMRFYIIMDSVKKFFFYSWVFFFFFKYISPFIFNEEHNEYDSIG